MAEPGFFWKYRVYQTLVGDAKKTKAKTAIRKINGKKTLGVITKDLPKGMVSLPPGVFKLEIRHKRSGTIKNTSRR